MRIGIITFHNALNYGAVLQCFALKRTLEDMGHECHVINYCPVRPSDLSRAAKAYYAAKDVFLDLDNRSLPYRLFRAVRRAAKRVLFEKMESNSKKEIAKHFQIFRSRYFALTREYKYLSELRENPPDCDVYICGSDQIWNSRLTGGSFDAAYFLGFGNTKIRKISYAVSVCGLRARQFDQIRPLLNNLHSISLREEKNRSIIEKLAGKEVYVCPDPTLLLNRDDYINIEEEKRHRQIPYIFIFLLWKGDAPEIAGELVRVIRESETIDVVEGSPEPFCKIDNMESTPSLSPGEWLSYIHHAKYVITNSFHCLSLSTIYGKDVFVVPCSDSNIERLEEHCRIFGIESRFIHSCDMVSLGTDYRIDYNSVESIRDHVARCGKAYLTTSIG